MGEGVCLGTGARGTNYCLIGGGSSDGVQVHQSGFCHNSPVFFEVHSGASDIIKIMINIRATVCLISNFIDICTYHMKTGEVVCQEQLAIEADRGTLHPDV